MKSFYCTHCGTVGSPKTHTPGHFLIEVLLWLCFLIPGVVYSLWRLSARKKVCPACKAPGMIPADSPIALKARAEGAPQV